MPRPEIDIPIITATLLALEFISVLLVYGYHLLSLIGHITYPPYRAYPSYGYGWLSGLGSRLLGGEMDPIWVGKCLGSWPLAI